MSERRESAPNQTGGCQTCYGTGEIVTEHGAVSCPDCYGDGKAANRGNKMEWRLRDLERTYRSPNHECFADVMWLVHELRLARDALILILSRCQDADEGDETARYVRSQAMEALGLYDRAAADSRDSLEKV
jgi:hypothetical protein